MRGTKGFYEMNTNTVFIEGEQKEDFWTPSHSYRKLLDNGKEYAEKYLPALWKNITPEDRAAGHGGMDYFTVRAFLDALKAGEEMPIDVYDMASWMCITALTEASIREGGKLMEIPDFTKGAYKTRTLKDVISF